jgi:hypothetical protein
MLVASRPENQIKTSLETSTHQKGREQSKTPWAIIRLRGEDETDAISDDVSKVVDAKIEIMTRQGLPMDILEQFQAELIARADRTFLWVSLILELLELKVLTGASRRELDELLRNKDIYKIYGELLSANKNQSGARKLLRIILGATRPLTIEEVSVALATPVEGDQAKGKHITFDDIEYDINWPFENHIRSLCGNFLRIIRNRVYFVHETAREFLLGGTSIVRGTIPRAPLSMKLLIQSLARWEKIEEPLKFQHGFNMDDCNMILLGICTTYLYCLGRRSKSA